MRYPSTHVERAVVCTRVLGYWSLIIGIGVIVWALICFPWVEPDRTHADYTYITVTPDPSSTADPAHSLGATPFTAAPTHDAPTEEFVDLHDPRSSPNEILGSIGSYILPAILLLLVSRSMARLNVWAYTAGILISIAFVAAYLLQLLALFGLNCPLHQEPIFTETLLRPFGLYLLALCLNARPDAVDEYHTRRNRNRPPPRAFEPIVSQPPVTRIPPRPVLRSPRE